MKTTKAIIIKFITSPANAPNFITIGPMLSVASCQAPPGIKGVIKGMIISSTNAFIKAVEATPIINATAKPIILYSLRNCLKSFIIPTDY